MQRRLGAMLQSIRWDRAVVERFVGCMLSEPKAHVFFEPPRAPLSLPDFVRRARRAADGAVWLDRRARMLYDSASVYLNGEAMAALADFALYGLIHLQPRDQSVYLGGYLERLSTLHFQVLFAESIGS